MDYKTITKMYKINLILDGNFLLNKIAHALSNNNYISELYNVLERDIDTLSNMYFFNKIYFISDSRRNWRKGIYSDYKMSRKRDTTMDWDYIYVIYDDFKQSLSERKKYKVYELDNMEGDDLISYIVKESNKNDVSNMIVANDSDLYQFICFTDKYINFMYNCFAMVFYGSNGKN